MNKGPGSKVNEIVLGLGDLVILNSGGPAMTIIDFEMDPCGEYVASCSFFEDISNNPAIECYALKLFTFPAKALRMLEDNVQR